MRKISLDQLNRLFAAIAGERTLYLPVDTENGAKYEKWEEGKALSDALNTVRSPKDFFFPQTENLVDFKMEGKSIEIIDTRTECEDFVVFGVRACDVKSFEILDRVFLSEPVDTYYKNRRDHGVIVSMACTKPSETCFCTTFGIDAAAPAGDNDILVVQQIENGLALGNVDGLGGGNEAPPAPSGVLCHGKQAQGTEPVQRRFRAEFADGIRCKRCIIPVVTAFTGVQIC